MKVILPIVLAIIFLVLKFLYLSNDIHNHIKATFSDNKVIWSDYFSQNRSSFVIYHAEYNDNNSFFLYEIINGTIQIGDSPGSGYVPEESLLYNELQQSALEYYNRDLQVYQKVSLDKMLYITHHENAYFEFHKDYENIKNCSPGIRKLSIDQYKIATFHNCAKVVVIYKWQRIMIDCLVASIFVLITVLTWKYFPLSKRKK